MSVKSFFICAREGDSRTKFILWNNKDISIDQKTLFWKTWFERGIYFVQDLLNEDGKFLSLDEFNRKFGLKANYLQYFQITAAIPSSLKQAALLTPVCSEFLFSTPDLFYLSEETTLSLSKMSCKLTLFSNSLIIHQVKTKKIISVKEVCPVLISIDFDDFTSPFTP